jgi:hypothetical protein
VTQQFGGVYEQLPPHLFIVYSKYPVTRSIDTLLKLCNITISTNMPKAAARKAGPQTARTAPYPTPSAPTTTNAADATPNATSSNSGPLTARSTNVPPKKASASTATAPPKDGSSFLDLTLPGEADNSVPVYDSCAQIRLKIKGLLEKNKDKPENAQPGVFAKNGTPKPWTAKAFCDAIGVSTSSYGAFMKKSGHMGGAENHTYYGAYVFFEKKRLWEGGKKSAARVKMESE